MEKVFILREDLVAFHLNVSKYFYVKGKCFIFSQYLSILCILQWMLQVPSVHQHNSPPWCNVIHWCHNHLRGSWKEKQYFNIEIEQYSIWKCKREGGLGQPGGSKGSWDFYDAVVILEWLVKQRNSDTPNSLVTSKLVPGRGGRERSPDVYP